MASASNEHLQIAKEILLATIEQKNIILPSSTNYGGIEGIGDYNAARINEINKAFTSLLNNIVESQASLNSKN